MKAECKVVILGAGLAGLSAAYYLRGGYEIFEKENRCGGLCRSRSLRGFTFDMAGHLLHFKDRQNFLLSRELLGNKFVKISRNSWIWSYHRFIRYPFQSNLYGLPPRVVRECLEDFKKIQNNHKKSHRHRDASFRTWLLETFGEGMAKHFLFPYNKKFWKFPLERLNAQGVRQWIPVPSLKDVQEGAFKKSKKEMGYNAHFWYPRQGGIQVLTDALEKRVKKVHRLCEAIKLDLKKKEVFFKSGLRIRFEKLISTIPLPELARILVPLPEDVRRAFLKLKYISVLNLNLGLSKKLDENKHWIYFPQRNISFYRCGIATNFSGSLAPAGCSSLYFEISYSKDHPADKNHLLERVLGDCQKARFCLMKKDVLVTDLNDIKYAYCLYDEERAHALGVIQPFLKKHGIFSIGRYGGWQYASMEDVMAQARHTAYTILKQ